MGFEEKNMNENLSQIVSDLFVNLPGGDGLSSKIDRLRNEIKRVMASEEAIYGKFLGLLESLREIIPDEKQRYNAALKALATTSKLSRKEIVRAVGSQLEELAKLEKGLQPALPDWRGELRVLEAKSKEMKDEITKLREKIVLLETDEKAILAAIATREKDVVRVEKAMKELFADIGAEIAQVKKGVEEFTAQSSPVQPSPQRAEKIETPAEKKGSGREKREIPASAPNDTEWEKKCPMCGGRMNFHATEQMWMCYSCAFEEPEQGGGPGRKNVR